jgi:hypothetical protein
MPGEYEELMKPTQIGKMMPSMPSFLVILG